jgi:hypothetical protein
MHETVNSQPVQPAAKQPQSWRFLIDTPWIMVLTLFFVTAALGLPFLWMSRGFSVLSKLVLTVLVLAWTALVLWVFWLIMVWCYTRIVDAL